MGLNFKNALLILFSIVYLFLLQFSMLNLEYYFLFVIGLVFFRLESLFASVFYFIFGIVSYIFGNEYYAYLLPVLTIFTNFYALDNTKTASFNRVVHLTLILLYFASQISSDNLDPKVKIVLINLISLFAIVRIDFLHESPMKYLYVILALHNVGQNISLITLSLFSTVVLIFIPNIATIARYGIIASWLYLLGEYNINSISYALCLALLSTAIISINKDKKMFLSGLTLSLVMFQSDLGVEMIIIFIALMLIVELSQKKNINKLC